MTGFLFLGLQLLQKVLPSAVGLRNILWYIERKWDLFCDRVSLPWRVAWWTWSLDGGMLPWGGQPLGSVPVSAQLSEKDINRCGGSRCSQWYRKERTDRYTSGKKGMLKILANLHLVGSREDSVRAEMKREPCWGIALEQSREAPEASPATTGCQGGSGFVWWPPIDAEECNS